MKGKSKMFRISRIYVRFRFGEANLGLKNHMAK